MIIMEMPYLKSPQKNGDKYFDLELENFNNSEDVISYLESIFSGDTHTDKYGNKITLKTYDEKKKLANDIKSNKFIYNMILSKLGANEIRLLNMLLNF